MKSLRDRYKDLLAIEDWGVRPMSQAANELAMLIDSAAKLGEVGGLERAIQVCALLRERRPTEVIAALLYYFEANAWAAQKPIPLPGVAGGWDWQNEAVEREFLLLRFAKQHAGFAKLSGLRKSQIFTNLANALDTLGRHVEALAIYDEALGHDPQHHMARGNRGICLFHVTLNLAEQPHELGLCPLVDYLRAANSALEAPEPVFRDYREKLERITHSCEHESSVKDREEVRQPWTKAEDSYRHWCLKHRLFLNPMNDIRTEAIIASDPLHIQSLVTAVGENPYVLRWFNQLKQEFSLARVLLHEGTEEKPLHFSDRGVSLIDLQDETEYSVAVEKTKTALRIAYSQFDKIGFLLNHYLELKIELRKIGFRTLWFEGQQREKGLRQEFVDRENLPLRGLYWLSRDIAARGDATLALDPDARDLVEIRNHAEHKFLHVHANGGGPLLADQSNGPVRSVSRPELEAYALRMLKLVRSALLYLAHAINVEEERRKGWRTRYSS